RAEQFARGVAFDRKVNGFKESVLATATRQHPWSSWKRPELRFELRESLVTTVFRINVQNQHVCAEGDPDVRIGALAEPMVQFGDAPSGNTYSAPEDWVLAGSFALRVPACAR